MKMSKEETVVRINFNGEDIIGKRILPSGESYQVRCKMPNLNLKKKSI